MKPLAEHGTTARAKGRPAAGIKGCTCRPCRDAENRYDKRRRVMNATGRAVRVPAGPAAAHLRALFEGGAGWSYIISATGCSRTTINSIRNGRQLVKRDVASRILAVPLSRDPAARVPALGSIRRLRALIAIGHRVTGSGSICDQTRLDQSLIADLLAGRKETLSAGTADRIATAYGALAGTPGGYRPNARRATARGWLGPAWWDDDEFENPNFSPATQTTPKYIAHVENLRELEAQGNTREQIADRLGVSRDTLQRAIAYHRERFGEAA